MKYKDVLNDLFDLLDRHRMIKRWGYGNLSDLVNPLSVTDPTQEDGTMSRTIDYPYAFLNPTNHTITKGKSTFRFNLIVMDQCTDSTYEVIETQSDAHEYIKDILAEIYYNFDQKYDFTLNSNLTPFKEKYNDTVSGMTANIELEIRDVLDDCIAPFMPKADQYNNLLIYLGNLGPKVLVPGGANNDYITIPTVGRFITNIENRATQAWWNVNRIQVDAGASFRGRIELRYDLQLVEGSGTIMPGPIWFDGGPGVVTGFPTEFDTKVRTVTQVWSDITLNEGSFNYAASPNFPGDEYDLQLTNIEIRLYN